jgi:membrane-bound lytic murein transglycosylase D
VTAPKQISLARAAELAEVDYDTLKRLNTGLKRDITPPQSQYQILMPSNAAQRFEAALVNAPPATTSTSSKHSQPTPIEATHIKAPVVKARTAGYRVQPGDSLWTIARRFNVSPKALMRWNDIDDPQVLRPGQSLRISDH